jgi:hypothetical protein
MIHDGYPEADAAAFTLVLDMPRLPLPNWRPYYLTRWIRFCIGPVAKRPA